MVLICISQIISDIGNCLVCLLALCMSSLKKCLFISYAYFLIACFFIIIELYTLLVWQLIWKLTPDWLQNGNKNFNTLYCY